MNQDIRRIELNLTEMGVYIRYNGWNNEGWELVSRAFYECLEKYQPEAAR